MKPLALLTLISVIAITAWNYAVNAIPLNGINTGAVSAKYATLITPAGYAFAIWGLIYLGLTAFAIYQILPTQNGVGESLDKIRTLLIINLLLTAFWLFAFPIHELRFLAYILQLSSLVVVSRSISVFSTSRVPLTALAKGAF